MMATNQIKPRRDLVEMRNDTSRNNVGKVNSITAQLLQNKKAQMIKEFINERTQQLEQETEIMKQESRQLIGNVLFKLPKSVRSMTLGEYENMYGVNLMEELPPPSRPTVGTATSSIPFDPMTPAPGYRNASHFPKATPMTLRNRPMATPATVRTLRRGEAVYSQRGSPLNTLEEGCLVATVVAPRRRPGMMAGAKHTANGNPTLNSVNPPASPEIDFHLGAGQCLSLKDADSLHHLDSSAKESAAAQIRIMKDRMDRILSRLEQE